MSKQKTTLGWSAHRSRRYGWLSPGADSNRFAFSRVRFRGIRIWNRAAALFIVGFLLVAPGCSGCSKEDATAPLTVRSTNDGISQDDGNTTDTSTIPTAPPVMSEDDIGACLFVLRQEMQIAFPDSVCFIAIGRNEREWIDPPAGFLDRLRTPALELRPASESGIPVPSRRLDPSELVEDAKESDGANTDSVPADVVVRPRLYHATVTKWVDESTVVVTSGSYAGPQANQDSQMLIENKDGVWRVKEFIGGGSF